MSAPRGTLSPGPRMPLLVRIVVILLAVGVPAAALALQKPGVSGEGEGQFRLGQGAGVWYCAYGQAAQGTAVSVDVVNPSARRAAKGRVTEFSLSQRAQSRQIVVPELSSTQVSGGGPARGRAVDRLGMAVELDVTDAAVVQTVAFDEEAITGTAVSQCARGTSPTRYFAGGSSLRGVDTYLTLFNPFPQDAVVDVVVYTEAGPERPPDLQQIPVLAGASRDMAVSEKARRKSALGMEVRTSAGQVVAEVRVVSRGERMPAGVTLSSGVVAPQTEWVFADGLALPDAEVFSVMNPYDREALVEIAMLPEPGLTETPRPQITKVPAQTEITVTVGSYFPEGARYGAVFRSKNDVALVVDRTLGRGRSQHGLSVAPGLSPASTWLLPLAGTAQAVSGEGGAGGAGSAAARSPATPGLPPATRPPDAPSPASSPGLAGSPGAPESTETATAQPASTDSAQPSPEPPAVPGNYVVVANPGREAAKLTVRTLASTGAAPVGDITVGPYSVAVLDMREALRLPDGYTGPLLLAASRNVVVEAGIFGGSPDHEFEVVQGRALSDAVGPDPLATGPRQAVATGAVPASSPQR